MERNEISAVLAERIGKLRTAAGESQQDLADKIGVKRETVKFWESGDRQIKGGDIAKIAKHFNVSADYLLGLSDVLTSDKDLKFVCEYTRLSEESIKAILDIPEYVGGKDYLHALDEMICEFGYELGACLWAIEQKTQAGKDYLSKPHTPSKDHPPIVDFSETERLIELIEVASYRFSKCANRIPDALIGPDSVLSDLHERLDLIVMGTSLDVDREEAADDGQHTED